MKQIYIILSQSGTLFSRAIRWYTKDPYNHSSLAFKEDMEVMYSFGRKKRYNPLNNGFVFENFEKGLYQYYPDALCCIIEITVTEEEYRAMKLAAAYFCENQQNYRYNLLGIFGHILGIGVTRKDHFFCSQFVSFILRKTDFWNRVPEFTKPMDFYHIPNKKIIFEGRIRDFRDFSYRYSLSV